MSHKWSAERRMNALRNRIKYIDDIIQRVERLEVPPIQDESKGEVLDMMGIFRSLLRQEYRLPACEVEREELRIHPILDPSQN